MRASFVSNTVTNSSQSKSKPRTRNPRKLKTRTRPKKKDNKREMKMNKATYKSSASWPPKNSRAFLPTPKITDQF